MSTYSIQRVCKIKPANSWDKISFQYSTSTGKETPFRSQIDYIKRPRASKHAKEIITFVIFRTHLRKVSSDSIKTDGYSRNKCIVFYYSVQLVANVTPCVGVCASRTVLIRLAMYGAGFCSGS